MSGIADVAGMSPTPSWPAVPAVGDWSQTRTTLHMWTQIVGKTRLALSPRTNHWWSTALYVTATGLTTSLLPLGGRGIGAGAVEIRFDFVHDRLVIERTDGRSRQVALEQRTTADFFAAYRRALDELEIEVPIHRYPVEVTESVPFDLDERGPAYDREAVLAFWHSLVAAQRVLERFRGEWRGKASPVHFFWGAFDLAVTRFSGRDAPPHPGGVPNCPDRVMIDAYDAELASAGYWPGGSDEGSFYAYAYPERPGFRDARMPEPARYDDALGEYVLPYRAVREAMDGDELVLRFLRRSFRAAAESGSWPRGAG